ncbi:MAG: ECF-type sigma factor [Planctomycetota bacterium]
MDTDPTFDDGTIGQTLRNRAGDDPAVAAEILPAVYEALRRLAHRRLAREPVGHSVVATELVHEAYARLTKGEPIAWQNRRHFFGAAAEAMRRIVVERARSRRSEKRGGRHARQEPSESCIVGADPGLCESSQIVALDAALAKLRALDERKAEIVMLRYFSGLTIEETAQALCISITTVKDEWAFARAWLRAHLRGGDG